MEIFMKNMRSFIFQMFSIFYKIFYEILNLFDCNHPLPLNISFQIFHPFSLSTQAELQNIFPPSLGILMQRYDNNFH